MTAIRSGAQEGEKRAGGRTGGGAGRSATTEGVAHGVGAALREGCRDVLSVIGYRTIGASMF